MESSIRRARGAVAVALLVAAPVPGFAQESERLPDPTPSTHGLPGLVSVPAAAVPGAGTVDLNVNTARNRALFPRVDDQYNVQFGISFFDRLFIGARGTEVPPPGYEPVDSGPGDPSLARDLSPNVQLLVVEEGAVRPSVAVGAHDFAGAAPHFESRHVVVGKSFRGLARLTLGYGTGPDFLDGPFGGIEVAPLPGVSLLGEYDAEHVNLGFRAQLRSSWMRRNDLPEPALDVLWKEEGGFGVGVTLRNDLARRESAGPAPEDDGGSPSTFPYPGPLAHPDSGSTEMQVAALRQRLADLGFENVRAGLDPDGILGVEYENRRFNRNELDGLARALRASLAFAPEEADALRLTIRRLDAPILRLTAPTDALERWMEGGVENGRMLESVGVRYPGSDDGASALPGMSDEPANRSRFRSDVFIDPSFATAGFWERGVLDVRFTLNPRAQVQLLPGTLLEVGAELPVIQTEDFNVFRGSLPDPVVSPVLLHHARRLPVSVGGAPLFAQWSAGRFSRFFGGARQETALFLMDGRLRLGSEVGLLVEKAEKLRLGNDGFEHFREQDSLTPDRPFAVGSARYFLPELDLHVGVSAGRYLDRDWGWTAEASRFFHDVEIGFFLRDSERGSLAGIRLSLPLSPGTSLKPGWLRPRLPSGWSYGLHSTVFTERNVIRNDIARGIPGGRRLDDLFFDRDRLNPAYVKEHLADPAFWVWVR